MRRRHFLTTGRNIFRRIRNGNNLARKQATNSSSRINQLGTTNLLIRINMANKRTNSNIINIRRDVSTISNLNRRIVRARQAANFQPDLNSLRSLPLNFIRGLDNDATFQIRNTINSFNTSTSRLTRDNPLAGSLNVNLSINRQ